MNNSVLDTPGLRQNREFKTYLASTALAGTAFSMQQLLLSWMLVGILLLPADRVGIVQAVVGIPGIFMMLWGGASADRFDPRSLLIKVYVIAWLVPLALALAISGDLLNIWTVMLFGLGMSTITSFSSPAQQAILNRIAGRNLQKGVTAATAIGFIVQIIGLTVAGQMERVGLIHVLTVQGICLFLGAIAVHRLSAMTPAWEERGQPTYAVIIEGLKATFRNRVIFNTLVINFISSIFNAGAFMTVLPFLIKRIYEGNALSLSIVMILFFAGATVSNLLMLKLMPFVRPGRVFLAMQLSRVVIVAFIWFSPPWWLFTLVMFVWGLNMGVTSTLARTIVQESAEPRYLGRIMSVFSLGMLGSAPIGALVLGFIIEAFGTLNALVPAMIVSTLLFVFGVFLTNVWTYRSPPVKTMP